MKVALNWQKNLSASKEEKHVKKSVWKDQNYNSKSFNEIQTDHEFVKRNRLMELANTREQEVLSNIKNPVINSKSKRLAMNRSKKGNIHDRLYREDKKKLLLQAQEVMDNLSHNHSNERVNSCNRKLINNILEKEERELTFKPKIQKKSQSISRGGRIEERLIEDAHKRKMRQNNREKIERNKIHELK